MKNGARLHLEVGSWYWDKWSRFLDEAIARSLKLSGEPSKNPHYDPQFTFNTAIRCRDSILFRYAKGDDVVEIGRHFPDLLDMWEMSNRLAEDVCREEALNDCRDWTFELSDLNHYTWCFWLVGLALALEVPTSQWKRLLVLIGGAGQDELLDRVISVRQPDRVIGTGVLHARPYARLLHAVDAPAQDQARLLRLFVESWYRELGQAEDARMCWYGLGDVDSYPLDRHLYFGRWCVEAAAAAKAFDLDDSQCLDHPHYPGDLLQDGRCPRYPVDAKFKFNALDLKFGTAPKTFRLGDWLIRVLTGKPPLRR